MSSPTSIGRIIRQRAGLAFPMLTPPERKKFYTTCLADAVLVGNFKSRRDLIFQLRRDGASQAHAWNTVCDMLRMNTTRFFRHSRQIREFADRIASENSPYRSGKRLEIWSAGCSTGEEAITLALVLAGLNRRQPVDYRILGSDLSGLALAQASLFIFRSSQVRREVPREYLRFFKPGVPRGQCFVHLDEEVSRRISWARHNLIKDPIPRKKFDVIFFRNVLVHLDTDPASIVLSRLAESARPGGLLFVSRADVSYIKDRVPPEWEWVSSTTLVRCSKAQSNAGPIQSQCWRLDKKEQRMGNTKA